MKKKYFKIFKKYKNLSVVLKASFWFAAVAIIDKAIALLTQPFINRILTTEQVGVYGIYSSWYSIFSIIATLNLFCGVFEIYLTKEKNNKHNISGSLGMLCLIASLIFFGILFCFIYPVSDLLGLKPTYILIMAVTIIGDSLIQFWAVPKRFDYSYKAYAFLIIGLFAIKSALSIGLTYAMAGDRILGRLLGLCIPTIICGIVLFIFVLSKTNFKEITKYWAKALKFNIPLIPHYLAVVILSSSDKVMIGYMTGKSDAGLYSIAYLYASLSLIVFNAINLSYNPRSLQYLKEEKYIDLQRLTEVIVVVSIVFALVLTYLAPEGLFIIAGEEYLQTLSIIPALVVGIFFSSFYFVFSNVEFVHEKTKFVLIITLIGTFLNVGLNYALIPVIGYEVAAYTTFVGYLVIAILHFFVCKHIVKKDIFNMKKLSIYVLAYIAMSFLSLITYNRSRIVRYVFVIIFISILVYYFIKKKNVLFNNKTDNE